MGGWPAGPGGPPGGGGCGVVNLCCQRTVAPSAAVVSAMPMTTRAWSTSDLPGLPEVAGTVLTCRPAVLLDMSWSPALTAPSAGPSWTTRSMITVMRAPAAASCPAMPTYRAEPRPADGPAVVFCTVDEPATSTGSPPVMVLAAVKVPVRPGSRTGA